MRRLIWVLWFGGLVACGGSGSEAESESESEAEAESEAESETESDALPTLLERPVEEELALPEARTLRIPMRDGLELVGDLRAGHALEAALVILVHQLSTTRAEWEPLLRRLGAPPALATFALDMRGHGESTQRRGRTIAWADFETADWERVADDIVAVLDHLRDEEGLAPARVILVGSSIGSSAVVLAAAREPSVDAVVALSPGRAYRGVDAIRPIVDLGTRPLLTIASRGEPPSADTASTMAAVASSGVALLVDGDRHGVGMFESAPQSLERVVSFVRAQANPTPRDVAQVPAPAP